MTYNNEETIVETLKALRPSNAQDDIEIVLWDNASSDSTLSNVKDLDFPNLTVYTSSLNMGFSAASNQASRLSSNEILVFLNPDCVLDLTTLKELTNRLTKSKEKLCVSPEIRNVSGGRHIGGGWQPSVPRLIAEILVLPTLFRPMARSGIYARQTTSEVDLELEVEWVAGTCMAIRRGDFVEVGGFPEWSFMYCEDMDLGRSMKQKSMSVVIDRRLSVDHVGEASYRSDRSAQEAQLNALKKYYSLSQSPTPSRKLLFDALVTIYSVQKNFRKLLGRLFTD